MVALKKADLKRIQYPVGPPSNSITLGTTFLKWPMYRLHFSIFTVSQKTLIPSTNWSLVFGFISLLRNSFSSCQRFSIGLRSGDSAGVFHQLISSFSNQAFALLEVCLGSLSCMNNTGSSLPSINGFSPASKTLIYPSASIFPSKTTIGVGPFQLMPAHTCTLVGCLGLFKI